MTGNRSAYESQATPATLTDDRRHGHVTYRCVIYAVSRAHVHLTAIPHDTIADHEINLRSTWDQRKS